MKAQLANVSCGTRAASCPPAPALPLHHQRLLLKAWLVLTDALVLAVAFGLAYFLRFRLQVAISPDVVPDPRLYPGLALSLIVLLILVFIPFKLYDPHALLGGVLEYSRTFNASTTGTMMVVVATFLVPQLVVSRGWLISAWALCFILVVLNRFLTRRMAYALRQRGYLLSPAVIIGTNQEARILAADLSHWRFSGLRVVGVVCTSNRDDGILRSLELPLLGSTREVRQIIEQYQIEDLVVAITAVNRKELLRLCEDVNSLPGVHLRISSGLYELLTTRVTVKTLGPVPLISLEKVRLRPAEIYIKAALEYSLALLALLLLSPVLLFLAVLIRLDSPGPAIHRRRVLGISGKEFDAFKFRTMHVNGDELLRHRPELAQQLRIHHKLKQDPRITRVGRWLRKYSLDELPQLFNVLLGQMGLVGPRMISSAEAQKYGPDKLNLLTVKPGITGLWQVSGRCDLSYEERVRLDMYYVRNYSVWLDLQILFVQTLPAVLGGRGAY